MVNCKASDEQLEHVGKMIQLEDKKRNFGLVQVGTITSDQNLS